MNSLDFYDLMYDLCSRLRLVEHILIDCSSGALSSDSKLVPEAIDLSCEQISSIADTLDTISRSKNID